MFFEIITVVLSIAFLVFIVLSVPVLLQVRRTAKSMAHTLRMLNYSLPTILMNLEETTAHLNQTVRAVDERVQTFSNVFDHFQALLGAGSNVGKNFSFFKILKITPGILAGVNIVSRIFSHFAKKKKN
ncbi:MAG: DUF948 domain-containing protein [Desulfobacteraceae bacterium]|nr:MAG: DUF948 domain-containing protein [Desulfobacteraceae bacterium]